MNARYYQNVLNNLLLQVSEEIGEPSLMFQQEDTRFTLKVLCLTDHCPHFIDWPPLSFD